jgi:hypothetical protein
MGQGAEGTQAQHGAQRFSLIALACRKKETIRDKLSVSYSESGAKAKKNPLVGIFDIGNFS